MINTRYISTKSHSFTVIFNVVLALKPCLCWTFVHAYLVNSNDVTETFDTATMIDFLNDQIHLKFLKLLLKLWTAIGKNNFHEFLFIFFNLLQSLSYQGDQYTVVLKWPRASSALEQFLLLKVYLLSSFKSSAV